ncbi:MAG: hypothetical protein OXE59_06315 [Bacteroidetes bacterium]|nr:hypothetical protein [Bacteroidota bacterium]MCY4233338.1 hypothetical protein [Bacteroidota bacterium]
MLGPRAMLRSKTPNLIQQEYEGLMLAYYAVRALITQAGKKSGRGSGPIIFRAYRQCSPTANSTTRRSPPRTRSHRS